MSYSLTVRDGRNVEFEISYRSPSLRLVISASSAWRPLASLSDAQIDVVARFLPGKLGLLLDPQEQPGLAGYEQGDGEGATLTRLAYSSAIDGRLGVIDSQRGADPWHAVVYPATTNRMRSLVRHVIAMNERADVLARHAGELRESFQHLH